MPVLSSNPLIEVHDSALPESLQKSMQDYLITGAWTFGSVSSLNTQSYPYWYHNFGGFDSENIADCEQEVARGFPIIADVWSYLKPSLAEGQKLVRCYANGYPYGCEGTVHMDSSDPNDRTFMLYANPVWNVNWAGETVFLTPPIDVIAAVMPRPNRLVVFQANVPHVARAISRLCPQLRITLMFKTTRV